MSNQQDWYNAFCRKAKLKEILQHKFVQIKPPLSVAGKGESLL